MDAFSISQKLPAACAKLDEIILTQPEPEARELFINFLIFGNATRPVISHIRNGQPWIGACELNQHHPTKWGGDCAGTTARRSAGLRA
jgi:hypothetical protein